ncbi:hypothetical protein EB796_011960 [Bugula neritina]|uniref:Uncharacterized protein n=1 Tax=Bugula neritina TaxID=10212 RepID=A0A7J7JTN0_BUGNE|nr:hypothetical protein EB796_011960 [Bugula neritina]
MIRYLVEPPLFKQLVSYKYQSSCYDCRVISFIIERNACMIKLQLSKWKSRKILCSWSFVLVVYLPVGQLFLPIR